MVHRCSVAWIKGSGFTTSLKIQRGADILKGICHIMPTIYIHKYVLFTFYMHNILTRGPYAALFALINVHSPTNIILDIIAKGIRRVSS